MRLVFCIKSSRRSSKVGSEETSGLENEEVVWAPPEAAAGEGALGAEARAEARREGEGGRCDVKPVPVFKYHHLHLRCPQENFVPLDPALASLCL